LLTAYTAAVLLGYDKGTAAGLLAGSLTQSAILGSAGDAIGRLDRDLEAKRLLSDNASVAYAVSYLFGTAGVAWFLSRIGPRLLGVDLAAACAALAPGNGEDGEGEVSATLASGPFLIRAFRVLGTPWTGTTVGEIEAAHSGRLLIERVRHQGELHEADPDTHIYPGDTVALAGDHEELFPLLKAIGEEADDPELLAFPLETLPVVVTSKAADGKTLKELLRAHGRGVSITRLTRSGREMPLTPGRHAHRGDTLHLVGPRRHVEQAALALGYANRPGSKVDVVYVALGIALGALIGVPALSLGGVSLGLGAAGGILVAGLTFGWLRSRRPTFGHFPVPAMWVFEVLGLHLFLAAVGISSGPAFVTGLVERGARRVVPRNIRLVQLRGGSQVPDGDLQPQAIGHARRGVGKPALQPDRVPLIFCKRADRGRRGPGAGRREVQLYLAGRLRKVREDPPFQLRDDFGH
jgi:putative transport protein